MREGLRLAAIDIGSNSVHMVVAQVDADRGDVERRVAPAQPPRPPVARAAPREDGDDLHSPRPCSKRRSPMRAARRAAARS